MLKKGVPVHAIGHTFRPPGEREALVPLSLTYPPSSVVAVREEDLLIDWSQGQPVPLTRPASSKQCPAWDLTNSRWHADNSRHVPSSSNMLWGSNLPEYVWMDSGHNSLIAVSRHCASMSNSLLDIQEPNVTNPNLEYGWEIESSDYEIANYYRRTIYSDVQWTAMHVGARVDMLWSAFRGNAPWSSFSFTKLAGAPDFLPQELSYDGFPNYELRSEGGLTKAELVRHLNALKEFEGRWHIHLSFPSTSSLRDVDSVEAFATFFVLINEYAMLREYGDALRDAHILLHRFNAPVTTQHEDLVLSALNRREDPHDFAKYLFVGFGCEERYGPGRCGVEIRAFNEFPERQLALVDMIERFLIDPAAPIKLGEAGSSYDLASLAGMQILSDYFVRQHTDANPNLLKVNRAAADLRGVSVEGDFMLYVFPNAFYLPLIAWEDRPFLNAQTELIVSARQTYRNRFEAIAQEVANEDLEEKRSLLVLQLMHELHLWATQTQLWKWF